MSDVIHSPEHYTDYPVQPIEIARHLGFCMGNVVMYALSAPYAGVGEPVNDALKYLELEQEIPMVMASQEASTATEKIKKLSDYLHGVPFLTSTSPYMEVIAECQADFLDLLESYLQGAEETLLTRIRSCLASLAEAIETDHCRICGCTDEHACEGGCYWVEEDLCSACAEKNLS